MSEDAIIRQWLDDAMAVLVAKAKADREGMRAELIAAGYEPTLVEHVLRTLAAGGYELNVRDADK